MAFSHATSSICWRFSNSSSFKILGAAFALLPPCLRPGAAAGELHDAGVVQAGGRPSAVPRGTKPRSSFLTTGQRIPRVGTNSRWASSQVGNLFFTYLFGLEVMAKTFALYPRRFFRDPWLRFDQVTNKFRDPWPTSAAHLGSDSQAISPETRGLTAWGAQFITLISFLGLSVELAGVKFGFNPTILRILRVFRVVSRRFAAQLTAVADLDGVVRLTWWCSAGSHHQSRKSQVELWHRIHPC